MAKQVTDLGGYADVIMQGGSLSNELTNGEIDELVKHYKIKKYHGCHIDDQLSNKLSDGYYVINLNGHSHWCCLLKDKKHYYYFDSYSFPASQEIEDQIGEYIYSDVQLQDMNSTSCGFYCLAFMKWMEKNKNKELAYTNFLKLFTKDTKENELILNERLKRSLKPTFKNSEVFE